ncbi:MAG: hypothetical protein ABI690_33780 [Chloroflexota bacterium]
MMLKDSFKVVIQRAILALFTLSLLSLLPQSDVSAAYNQQTQLLPSDPAAANEMGTAIFFSSTFGIVGVRGDSDRGADSGSAYVWHYNGATTLWEKEAKLTAPDASPGDRFGSSVTFRNEYAAIAAPNWNENQGAVYVYQRIGSESWPLYAILTADDGAAGDEFGASISMGDGGGTITRMAIGAPGKDAGTGAVYLFEVDGSDIPPTWAQVSKLTPADGAAGDRFGTSVYTDQLTPGTFTIVGSPNDDDAGTDSGSVYVYVPSGVNTWSQETKLNGGDSADGDHFGTALTNLFNSNMSDQITVIVGAPDADSPAEDAGAVYTFKRTNPSTPSWTEGEKLIASDTDAGDHFGASVAHFIDNYAAIGAPGDDAKGSDAGAAYIFDYANNGGVWIEAKKLLGTESAAGDHYGASVAIDDTAAVIGAPFETGDVGQAQSGALHVHNRLANWGQFSRLTAAHNAINDSFGASFAIDGNYAIVGAGGDDDGGHDPNAFTDQGAAYIFFKNGVVWSQQARLTASDNGRNTQFGGRVAINGNTALVTATTVDGSIVYVYVRNGSQWTQQARLISPIGVSGHIGATLAINGDWMFITGDEIGDKQRYFYKRTGSNWALQDQFAGAATSAAMDGNWAVIGSPTVGADGTTYIYHWDGSNWGLTQTLTPGSDSSSSTMSFGYSVAVNGTSIAIGAKAYSDPGKSGIGAVYTYTYDGANWNFQQLLKRSGGVPNDGMGISVSVEGSRIVAGMSAPASGSERAILFRNLGGTWTQVQNLTRNTTFDDYGQTVALENNELWVTAPFQTVGGASSAGTVYAYNYTPDADLAVELTDVPGVIAGFYMTYEVTVTNNGQENATVVSIVDTLPGNVAFVSATAGCTRAANIITCAIGNLNIGDSQTVEINVTVNGAATGILMNQATVSSALADPNMTDNSANQDTQVVPAPGVPTPISPVSGSSTTNTQPTFTWSAVSGITYYEVQLDIVDPPIGIYSGFNVGATFKPPAPLLYTKYYWRVRSVDDFNIPSPWSATQILFVNAPDTVAPIRNVSNAIQPILNWTPVTWATGYEVEIAADKNFAIASFSSGTLPATDSTYMSQYALPNGTWYWRVRALKADGVTWSAWSTPETIQVIAP